MTGNYVFKRSHVRTSTSTSTSTLFSISDGHCENEQSSLQQYIISFN